MLLARTILWFFDRPTNRPWKVRTILALALLTAVPASAQKVSDPLHAVCVGTTAADQCSDHQYLLAIANGGSADGNLAISNGGYADAFKGVAISNGGYADGGVAIANGGTADAGSCFITYPSPPSLVALCGAPGAAANTTGTAQGGVVNVSGTGAACGYSTTNGLVDDRVAVSGTGNTCSSGNTVAVSGTGGADGTLVSLSGTGSAGFTTCGTVSFSATGAYCGSVISSDDVDGFVQVPIPLPPPPPSSVPVPPPDGIPPHQVLFELEHRGFPHCWGRSHWPHRSSTQAYTVAAKGTSWCLSSQPLVYVRTTLYVLIGPSLQRADWDYEGVAGVDAG